MAEKTAFEVTKKQASHEFWVTSAYILLGDIYVAQKDWFNALATYKSVTDNATITSLKEEAGQKYNLAQTAEKFLTKLKINKQSMSKLFTYIFITFFLVISSHQVFAWQKRKLTPKLK